MTGAALVSFYLHASTRARAAKTVKSKSGVVAGAGGVLLLPFGSGGGGGCDGVPVLGGGSVGFFVLLFRLVLFRPCDPVSFFLPFFFVLLSFRSVFGIRRDCVWSCCWFARKHTEAHSSRRSSRSRALCVCVCVCAGPLINYICACGVTLPFSSAGRRRAP